MNNINNNFQINLLSNQEAKKNQMPENIFNKDFKQLDYITRKSIVTTLSTLSEHVFYIAEFLEKNDKPLTKINEKLHNQFINEPKLKLSTLRDEYLNMTNDILKNLTSKNALDILIQLTTTCLGIDKYANLMANNNINQKDLQLNILKVLSIKLGNWLINNYDRTDTVFNFATFHLCLTHETPHLFSPSIEFEDNITLIADIPENARGKFTIHNGVINVHGSSVDLTVTGVNAKAYIFVDNCHRISATNGAAVNVYAEHSNVHASGDNTTVYVNGENTHINLSGGAITYINEAYAHVILYSNAAAYINCANSTVIVNSESRIIFSNNYCTQINARTDCTINYLFPHNDDDTAISIETTNPNINIKVFYLDDILPVTWLTLLKTAATFL
jgi:hypothetical protein